MVIAIITSKNGISIRLTEERWKHIVLLHPNLADKQTQVLDAIKDPDYIFRGKADELLAVSKLSARVYLVVVYKEVKTNGFIITAYDTTDVRWLFKKKLIWSKDS